MRRLFFVPSWVGLMIAACAPTPPPNSTTDSKPEPNQPESAEWLYVTDGVAGGRKGECQAVVARIVEERQRCKGSLCRHGAILAKDWLTTCKSLTPELVADVEQHVDALAKKAKTPATPCEEEVERVLREGSCPDQDCKSLVEGWGTRCGDASSPLVVKMLEVTIERRTGQRVRIDARGCSDLLGEFSKGVDCDQQFKCQDLIPAIDTYRGRCLGEGKQSTLPIAVSELSIRAGAAQKVEPISVAPKSAEPPSPSSLVALEDGNGAVLFVCGKRVPNLAAYLVARKGCEEDLTLAYRFDSTLRVGRLSHPNMTAFSRRFPTLAAKGEPEARYDAALPAFNASIEEIVKRGVEQKHLPDLLRLLTNAFNANADAIRNSKVFDAALRKHDPALVPLFRAIGEAKKKLIHADLEANKFTPAIHRAERFPLADVAEDGHMKLGASSPVSSLEIADMLPQAMAAYRGALEARFKRLAKIKPNEREQSRLSGEADGRAAKCAKAQKNADAAEKGLIACGFGLETCDESRRKSLETDLDQARKDSEVHYGATALGIASLSNEQRAGAGQAAKLAGCREPWW